MATQFAQTRTVWSSKILTIGCVEISHSCWFTWSNNSLENSIWSRAILWLVLNSNSTTTRYGDWDMTAFWHDRWHDLVMSHPALQKSTHHSSDLKAQGAPHKALESISQQSYTDWIGPWRVWQQSSWLLFWCRAPPQQGYLPACAISSPIYIRTCICSPSYASVVESLAWIFLWSYCTYPTSVS